MSAKTQEQRVGASDNERLVDAHEWPMESPNFDALDAAKQRAIDILERLHRSYREADTAIHVDDEMWNGLILDENVNRAYARLHYTYGGRSAMRSMATALIAARAELPKRILDFPSSHGRVARFLAKAFPEAEIIAGDVNRDGVDFCARRFGATPLYSSVNLDEVGLPQNLDLIWCSSLVTHLPLPRCEQLVDMFIDALTPGGLAGITWCSRAMDYAHHNVFKTTDDETYAKIRAQVDKQGAGYQPYPRWHDESYGMTFVTMGWLEALITKRSDVYVLSFAEKDWHATQDTLWLIKRPISQWYDWALD